MKGPDIQPLIENGMNKGALTCLHCASRILSPAVGFYVEKEFSLPQMTQQKNETTNQKDHLEDFWRVADMFQFDNIGFSHTVDGVKYLTCADCEMGPIGWHDLKTKESFIAVTRVENS